MTMSSSYSRDKPCSTGTHSETVKKLTLFCAIINVIMMESRLLIPNPVKMLSVLQSNQNAITFIVAIVIHKSRNLIGTLGSSEFGPK